VLYRIHQGPTPEKLEALREFMKEFGLQLTGEDDPQAADYSKLLKRIKGRPDAGLLQTVMLRSLRQAKYEPENIGHFGLGYEAYTHFTSPIRRYPDLLVHRAIRYLIRQAPVSKASKNSVLHREASARKLQKNDIYPYDTPAMAALGEHCSLTERRADEASRDVQSWLKCEYLQDHVGASYKGVISSVVSFGLFVELSELYVEGLVHVSSLQNDYYHFDAPGYRLVGERSGQSYKLGDEVLVQVVRVDLDERKIDFELQQLLGRPGGRIGKQQPFVKSDKKARQDHQDRKDSGRGRKQNKIAKPAKKTAGKKSARKFVGAKNPSAKNPSSKNKGKKRR